MLIKLHSKHRVDPEDVSSVRLESVLVRESSSRNKSENLKNSRQVLLPYTVGHSL